MFADDPKGFPHFLALRGRAGQPGPRAENRERGETEAWWKPAAAFPSVPSPEHLLPSSKKLDLALTIADGKSISEWAIRNDIPRRTAYRWASEPKVRSKVASVRRFTLDEALGVLSNRVSGAANGIAELSQTANSESVKLAALKSIISNMIAVSEFADLERRMTQIEERLDERAANAHHAG